jgi:protein-S-isoprenylcysteine O-methyltransferase Ste14
MNERRIPFTREDEDKIASAALWGTIVAIGTMAVGALDLVTNLLAGTTAVTLAIRGVGLVVTVMLGLWLLSASRCFRKVARTDEADKAYLLQGCRNLYYYFFVTGIALILLLTATLVGLIVALFLGASPTAVLKFG